MCCGFYAYKIPIFRYVSKQLLQILIIHLLQILEVYF